MNDFTGKICPYCKTEFNLDDDIVVCSECEMPHHKDCWIENQGCTTFGCQGTIQSADNATSAVTATQMSFDNSGASVPDANTGVVFCTRCGTQSASTLSFCGRCGNRLMMPPPRPSQPPAYRTADPNNGNPYAYVSQPNTHHQPNTQYRPNTQYQPNMQYQPNAQYQPNMQYQPNAQHQPNTQYQQNTQNQQSGFQHGGYHTYQSYEQPNVGIEMQQLVGTSTEYYIPRFREMKAERKAVSWNWMAFLFAPYWMMYRKIYWCAAVILAADIVIALIGSTYLSMLTVGGSIVSGILGNSLYMKTVESKAECAKAMQEPLKSQFIADNGGVNVTATVLSIVGRTMIAAMLIILGGI